MNQKQASDMTMLGTGGLYARVTAIFGFCFILAGLVLLLLNGGASSTSVELYLMVLLGLVLSSIGCSMLLSRFYIDDRSLTFKTMFRRRTIDLNHLQTVSARFAAYGRSAEVKLTLKDTSSHKLVIPLTAYSPATYKVLLATIKRHVITSQIPVTEYTYKQLKAYDDKS